MFYYTFGEVLKECRIRNQMTQKEVARGICSTATIARIEQGKQMPSLRVLEELLQRLGKASEFFSTMTIDAQHVLSENCTDTWNTEWNEDKEDVPYEKQLRAYVSLLRAVGMYASPEDVLEQLLGLLEQSCPMERLHGSEEMIAFTYLELWIMNSIAKTYYELEEYETAEEFLMKVMNYLKKHKIDSNIRGMIYPLVCHNLGVVYGRIGNEGKAEQYCEFGIQECINQGKLWILDELYGLYALVLQREGIEAQAEYASEQNVFLYHLKKKSDDFEKQKHSEKIMLFSYF